MERGPKGRGGADIENRLFWWWLSVFFFFFFASWIEMRNEF